jgi:serine/threonine protein kinase
MDPRMKMHMKLCSLNNRKYKKLNGIINEMLESCKTPEDLLTKFADKCYDKEQDRNLAKSQAATFMTAFYGGVDSVFINGPESAVAIELNKKYGKVESIVKQRSAKFHAHLHEAADDTALENHPMWTRKLDHYLLGPTLGVGGTAKVKLGYDPQTKTKVAIKILKPDFVNSAQKEIDVLKKLDHKNIVKVYDCFQNVLWDKNITTVFAIEYANQGELIEYLMYTSKFEDDLARWFFVNLTEGIEYCHGQHIIHRDLKHDNCLFGENFVLKITDFGFATEYYNEMMKTAIGTAQYAAPEILAGDRYTDSVDIFSMGVMLFIALAGSQPWRMANPLQDRWFKKAYQGNWDSFFKYHERIHTFQEDQKEILMGMLHPDPMKRWNLQRIKKSKWFSKKIISQKDVEYKLLSRKQSMDDKKFKAMMRANNRPKRKAVDIYSQKRPPVYFKPAPVLSFVTDVKAEFVLQNIEDVVTNQLRGAIIEKEGNKEKFKLQFSINKRIDSGRYNDSKNKKKKEKEYASVKVNASVRIWTMSGQEQVLGNNDKLISRVDQKKENVAVEEINKLLADLKPIEFIAVFRAEGGGEMRYLFPMIYKDILTRLPADLISETQYEDEFKD